MIWKGLILLLGVARLSSSSSAGRWSQFQRGDILFLLHEKYPVKLGDVLVFSVEGRDIPIVHRVIHSPNKKNEQEILTKGDNNYSDDTVLCAVGQIG